MGRGHSTDTQTNRRTSRLLDRIGPVGRFGENHQFHQRNKNYDFIICNGFIWYSINGMQLFIDTICYTVNMNFQQQMNQQSNYYWCLLSKQSNDRACSSFLSYWVTTKLNKFSIYKHADIRFAEKRLFSWKLENNLGAALHQWTLHVTAGKWTIPLMENLISFFLQKETIKKY